MARETKTVQVYPDDAKINATISFWENFGWEVINNQRCQEFTKQDSDGTQHYSTFNKITFSREKSSPWYNKVAQLESEYISTEKELESKSKAGNPFKKPSIIPHLIGMVILAFLAFKLLPGLAGEIVTYIGIAVGALLPIVIYIIRITNYNKHKDEMKERQAKWDNEVQRMRSRLNQILNEADQLING